MYGEISSICTGECCFTDSWNGQCWFLRTLRGAVVTSGCDEEERAAETVDLEDERISSVDGVESVWVKVGLFNLAVSFKGVLG